MKSLKIPNPFISVSDQLIKYMIIFSDIIAKACKPAIKMVKINLYARKINLKNVKKRKILKIFF
jgi:hypothetical protein